MQRSKHLEPLSHDHFEGLLVARRIHAGLARGAAPDVVAAYVSHFWEQHLTRHFRQEEEILAPLLSRAGASDLADRMVREHRHLEALVTALRADGPELATSLEAFATSLKAHIRFEERTLFPALECRAGEADLVQLSEQLQAAHVPADLDWPRAFWE